MPAWIRTVAVSQRGHGDSEKPPSGYGVDDFANDVPALLDALGIERAVLVAHSGSCLTARRVAIDHSDRVAGLVLEASPTTLAASPRLNEFVETVVLGLEDPIDPQFARSVVIDTSSAHVAPDVVDQFAQELRKMPARVWKEMFEALLTYDDRARLEEITAPTLLIWGNEDELVGREMQEELLRRLPNATCVEYTGVGHTPRWEDPARFAADVALFLEGIRLAWR